MIRLGMVTLDTRDPRPIAAWWAERLGGEIVFDADGWFSIVSAPDSAVNLGFQRVGDPTPGKNRMHLDLDRSAGEDRERMVAEWVAAGAVHLGQRGDADFGWDIFQDPDGNQFCIGDPH
ncbi:VOC family protein [Leucobacter weissii]|uniref:VOC family protein n=1 Tax=Leucobacter weissii TaxID=1983706 RepID=A0A939MH71_9MICO|nr:VOC family protein [Leucobacter weissii]MBO1900854.1 VOC family protein [Leucobacter weissii]